MCDKNSYSVPAISTYRGNILGFNEYQIHSLFILSKNLTRIISQKLAKISLHSKKPYYLKQNKMRANQAPSWDFVRCRTDYFDNMAEQVWHNYIYNLYLDHQWFLLKFKTCYVSNNKSIKKKDSISRSISCFKILEKRRIFQWWL